MMEIIIKRYLGGESLKSIIKDFKISYSTARRFLIRNKVRLRNKGKTGLYKKLSTIQKQIILGSLLGDGSFIKTRKTFCLCISHGGKQENYLNWKVNNLISVLGNKIYKRDRFDKRTSKTYTCLDYHSLSHPFFNKIYPFFYYNKKKGITLNILNAISDLAIVIWYCDNGNLYCNKDTHILTFSTDSFTIEENKLIINWFRKKYSLNFSLNGRNIRLVNLVEIIKFMNIFEKHIPNCMNYKKLSFYKNMYSKYKNLQCDKCFHFFKREL